MYKEMLVSSIHVIVVFGFSVCCILVFQILF